MYQLQIYIRADNALINPQACGVIGDAQVIVCSRPAKTPQQRILSFSTTSKRLAIQSFSAVEDSMSMEIDDWGFSSMNVSGENPAADWLNIHHGVPTPVRTATGFDVCVLRHRHYKINLYIGI
jgi:hypothetical protein